MQIAVWSDKKTGATTTSIAMATFIAAKYGYRTLILNSFMNDISLENYALTENELDAIGESNFESLLRLLRNGRLNSEMLKDYSFSILSNSNLDLLGTNKIYLENEEFLTDYSQILYFAKKFYDVIVIDLNADIDSNIFEKVVKNSEQLVVCIDQNVFDAKKLAKKLNEKKLDNLTIILNKYDIKNKLKKEISNILGQKKLQTLTYQTELINKCNNSELVDYILRQMNNKKKCDFGKYINELEKITKELLKEK